MVSDSAALVLFAIRSALKLGQQLRLAYVDNTKRRELVLPLPNFFSSPDVVSATNYFAGPGERHGAASARLAAMLHKLKQPELLSEAEQSELCAFHAEFFNVDLAQSGRLGQASDGSSLSAEELNALITIRQWRRGTDPNQPVAHVTSVKEEVVATPEVAAAEAAAVPAEPEVIKKGKLETDEEGAEAPAEKPEKAEKKEKK